MMRSLVALVMATLVTVSSSYGADRPLTDFKTSPGKYVGKISGCTGFLLAPSSIGTAGHCLNGSASGKFYLHYDDGNYTDSADLSFIAGTGTYEDHGNGKHLTDGLDWAVVRISKALGKTHGYLSGTLVAPKKDDPIALSGYGIDRFKAERATEDTACSVMTVYSDYFNHNCNSAKGHSGSPIVNRTTGRVVGVLIGFYNYIPVATPFSKLYVTQAKEIADANPIALNPSRQLTPLPSTSPLPSYSPTPSTGKSVDQMLAEMKARQAETDRKLQLLDPKYRPVGGDTQNKSIEQLMAELRQTRLDTESKMRNLAPVTPPPYLPTPIRPPTKSLDQTLRDIEIQQRINKELLDKLNRPR